MAIFRAKVVGLNRVQTRFKKYELRSDMARRAGIVKAALMIKKKAVMGTPRRTGNLANSAFVTMATGPVGSSGAFKGETAGKMAEGHAAMLAKGTAKAKAMTRKNRTTAAVGYSAVYARAVHENPNAGAAGFGGKASQTDSNFNRLRAEDVHSAVGGWKFLQNAVAAVVPTIPAIIRGEMRKGG